MPSKSYDVDFKKTIVDLYQSGKGASELSREYGLSKSNIYKWVSLYSPVKTSTGEVTSNDEILKLKKEMSKLKEENEIFRGLLREYKYYDMDATVASVLNIYKRELD